MGTFTESTLRPAPVPFVIQQRLSRGLLARASVRRRTMLGWCLRPHSGQHAQYAPDRARRRDCGGAPAVQV